MKNILLTVISHNEGNEQSQERFNSKLTKFRSLLKQLDAAGKKAAVKLTAHMREERDHIRIVVDAEDEKLRNSIYNQATHLTQ